MTQALTIGPVPQCFSGLQGLCLSRIVHASESLPENSGKPALPSYCWTKVGPVLRLGQLLMTSVRGCRFLEAWMLCSMNELWESRKKLASTFQRLWDETLVQTLHRGKYVEAAYQVSANNLFSSDQTLYINACLFKRSVIVLEIRVST